VRVGLIRPGPHLRNLLKMNPRRAPPSNYGHVVYVLPQKHSVVLVLNVDFAGRHVPNALPWPSFSVLGKKRNTSLIDSP